MSRYPLPTRECAASRLFSAASGSSRKPRGDVGLVHVRDRADVAPVVSVEVAKLRVVEGDVGAEEDAERGARVRAGVQRRRHRDLRELDAALRQPERVADLRRPGELEVGRVWRRRPAVDPAGEMPVRGLDRLAERDAAEVWVRALVDRRRAEIPDLERSAVLRALPPRMRRSGDLPAAEDVAVGAPRERVRHVRLGEHLDDRLRADPRGGGTDDERVAVEDGQLLRQDRVVVDRHPAGGLRRADGEHALGLEPAQEVADDLAGLREDVV